MVRRRLLLGSVLGLVLLAMGCEESSSPDGGQLCTVLQTPVPAFAELTPQAEPPAALRFLDGSPVRTPEEWYDCRRPELIRLFERFVYGKSPAAPPISVSEVLHDPSYFGGTATLRLLTLSFPPEGTPPIHLLLVTPNTGGGPAPVFLGLNFFGNHAVLDDPRIPLSTQWVPARAPGVVDNRATEASRGGEADRWPIREVLQHGFGVATLYHGDLDPDYDDFSNGVHPHFRAAGAPERSQDEWGALAAWAWGLSRAVDALVDLPEVDAERIAVLGHSRNGKAALLAGALDERISMVISNQSGCGGAALSRDKLGETVLLINTFFPHWFALEFASFNQQEPLLPIDQHLLLALIAPRHLLVLSAEEDAWSDPAGEFASTRLASEVYTFLGAAGLPSPEMPPPGELSAGAIGYHVRAGGHGIGLEDWQVFVEFAQSVWSGR